MSEENKKEEFKYTFIGPGSLIGKEEEKKELTEFKTLSFSKEEIPTSEQVIPPSTVRLEEKKEVKEGKLTLRTPSEKIEELKLEEEKKESFQPPNLSEITFKREERFTRPRKELLEEAVNLPEVKSQRVNFFKYLPYLISVPIFFILIFLIIYFKPYQEIVKLIQSKKETAPQPSEEPLVLPKTEEKYSETPIEEKTTETTSLIL